MAMLTAGISASNSTNRCIAYSFAKVNSALAGISRLGSNQQR
jgi:hypothetical protein